MVSNSGYINNSTGNVSKSNQINKAKRNQLVNKSSFENLLQQTVENRQLRFSKHAELRLKNRNIEMSEDQIRRLNDAVDKAHQKGVRESLVLLDDIAAVVSVRNKTVVTIVNENELKDNVFTNIDGAVIN